VRLAAGICVSLLVARAEGAPASGPPCAPDNGCLHRLARLLEPRTVAQQGYNVVFQPLENGKPAGAFEVFADGFCRRGERARVGGTLRRVESHAGVER
jgi:hypothetical protein